MKTLSALILLAITIPLTIAMAGIRVVDQQICTSVVDRVPQGSDSTFQAGLEGLTCFTKVSQAEAPTTITHVWLHGDKEMARVPLNIGASSWRTWSTKKLQLHWTGEWTVEVRDAEDKLLSTRRFRVTGAEGAAGSN